MAWIARLAYGEPYDWTRMASRVVDPATRDDATGGYLSELYYSYSTDAGVTWSPNEVLSPQFDPHVGWPQQNKMGDYFDMVSDEYGANLAYAATFNGERGGGHLRTFFNVMIPLEDAPLGER